MNKVNYIIVGQGIAGTMVTYFAQKANKQVIVINQPKEYTASKVSAGLMNPITGRKFVKSWKIDDLLPFAKQTYHELAELLGKTFFQSKNIIRAFSDNNAENNWLVRSSVPTYQQYVKEDLDLDIYKDIVEKAYGYGEIIGGGRVNITGLLSSFNQYLAANNQLLTEQFDYSDLKIDTDKVTYKNIIADAIIFCEGIGVQQNPFFNYLPIKGNKGEVLIIKIPNISPQKIIKQGIFLVPLGDELFWAGSTYFNQFDNIEPSEQGRNTLLEKINKVLKVPFEIVEHKAAVRPTVPDRRPLMGKHPNLNNTYVFNGMGTKGASLSPYWANHFIQYLENKTELDSTIDITRYAKYYS